MRREMPWFPDFVGAVELAHRQTRAAGQADPVGQRGSHELPPQAGIGVYDRGPGGLLAAARFYDDVRAPGGKS
jgi:hypothetical protein